MRKFKTRPFARFANREGITDGALCDALERAGRGLVDADLGGGVIKQRVARRGKGRSGGFRVIAVFRRQECAFFVHGFAKSDRDNLRRRELGALKALADQLLGLDEPGLKAMLANGTISEVICDAKAIRE
ncbi:MAG: type II toxin-antitoxin system RelE/ParE family toxin [Albidovulum sp.]|nr:type II toxin-antitoxin system RelE/ParE family toxin [Albidovulum sp.]MDE0530072.1 type II toxin-antitoxin system RelE/ParE family toxin [Albidovulum sp.]